MDTKATVAFEDEIVLKDGKAIKKLDYSLSDGWLIPAAVKADTPAPK